MKKVLLLALSAAIISCSESTENTQVEETQVNTETQDEALTGYFGDEITEEGAISSEEFLALIAENDSVEVKLNAKINETCRKKGCWMTVDLGNDKEMLVRFKDYGFFVPKNADGFNSIIQGKAKKTVLTVAELQHYAEDAGKSAEEIAAITEPEVKLAFEAIGVIIKE